MIIIISLWRSCPSCVAWLCLCLCLGAFVRGKSRQKQLPRFPFSCRTAHTHTKLDRHRHSTGGASLALAKKKEILQNRPQTQNKKKLFHPFFIRVFFSFFFGWSKRYEPFNFQCVFKHFFYCFIIVFVVGKFYIILYYCLRRRLRATVFLCVVFPRRDRPTRRERERDSLLSVWADVYGAKMVLPS